MKFAVRGEDGAPRERATKSDRRCPQCREQTLVLERRHVSPPQLGGSLVTEYYQCDCCDSRYQYSPAENRWRPLSS